LWSASRADLSLKLSHMGREATCHCKWGAEEGDCKVLLEGRELILRSGLRRRVSLSAMAGVAARGSKLVFTVGQDQVELDLGPETALRWAKAIQTPPPSLASKLGISPTTRLSIVGNIQSEELKEALAEATPASGKDANFILLCVNSQSELQQYFPAEPYTSPLWIVYPKGAKSEVKESGLRDHLRSRGFIDTKVASVSATFTALRFVKRKGNSKA
jgi:hypothetical protein